MSTRLEGGANEDAAVLAAATPAAETNAYVQHNLVSDGRIPAGHTDGHLVNAWALTSLPASPWWVADNGTDVSTLYGADGTPRSLVVSVPNASTGAVSNPGSSFVVGSGPALFLFSTEEGKLLGWNMSVGTTAQVVADKSGEDAIFKGLAIAGDRLYATGTRRGASRWRRPASAASPASSSSATSATGGSPPSSGSRTAGSSRAASCETRPEAS